MLPLGAVHVVEVVRQGLDGEGGEVLLLGVATRPTGRRMGAGAAVTI